LLNVLFGQERWDWQRYTTERTRSAGVSLLSAQLERITTNAKFHSTLITMRGCWHHAQVPVEWTASCRVSAAAYSVHSQPPAIAGGRAISGDLTWMMGPAQMNHHLVRMVMTTGTSGRAVRPNALIEHVCRMMAVPLFHRCLSTDCFFSHWTEWNLPKFGIVRNIKNKTTCQFWGKPVT
jgi:hypothetical protein